MGHPWEMLPTVRYARELARPSLCLRYVDFAVTCQNLADWTPGFQSSKALSFVLGFCLTSDPTANIGNGLKDLLHFSPGGTLFAFTVLALGVAI